ncbi:MAG: fasciclin domain-containing protein, partial [Bacteroidetes bacterium]|nr:fasciclin domain-containing protein [Bacteroidota bacterium]
SCDKDDDNDVQPAPVPQEKTVVDVAVNDNNFSILVEALQKANLVQALEGAGPFTVFAPTNDAFNQLFNALGVSGINDLTAETLTPILLYHVLGVKAESGSLNSGYFETLNTFGPDGNSVQLYVNVSKGVVLNGNTNVTAADVMASNGVIHVIDRVLLPPTVVDLAISNTTFSILVEAVVKAGLVDALNAPGPFTVFAPTNDAFQALFSVLGVSGIADLTAEQLTPILLYHVANGNVRSDMVSTGVIPSLNGANINVEVGSMGVVLNGSAKVIAVDVQGANGVIHVIDQVILPPTK